MTNIPIEQQRLLVNLVEQLEQKIAQGEPVSGDELLDAIEQSQSHSLADRLRDVVRKFSVSAVGRRGRPRNCKGAEDFALEELNARYPAVLQKYQDEAQQRRRLAAVRSDIPPSAEPSPSELAYREILREMTADFPNSDWEALRNKHSAWNNGRFHSAENHVHSRDFDAAIKRQFRAPRRRS
jgi:hypothetical protein